MAQALCGSFYFPFLRLRSRFARGCAGGGALSEDPFPGPADDEVHGNRDASKYQGDIDWKQRAGALGVEFAWIKATEGGDRVDDKFAQNWARPRRRHPARRRSFA